MGYKIFNGAMPTTAAFVKVATGTAIKTMLQVAPPAARLLRVLSWGFNCDSLQSGQIELIETDVAATVTAHVASGITKLDPNATASQVTLGTAATGYTASAEGAITTVRMFDEWQSGPSGSAFYTYQFLPNEIPIVNVSKFLRIRVTMGTTTNMVCWVTYEEIG